MRLVALSFALFSLLPLAVWQTYRWRLEHLRALPQYQIRRIVQVKRGLPDQVIADLLGLSQPTSLYSFSEKKGEKRLEEHMLIERAQIEKRFPDALHVDVKLRSATARLGDLVDAGIDRSGRIFPISESQRLTTFFLGINPSEVTWGMVLRGERYAKACEVLDFFSKRSSKIGLFIERVDTARAFEQSLGRCEIVVHLSEQSHVEKGARRSLLIHHWIVRLPTVGYEKRWGDLRALCEQLKSEHAEESTGELREEFAPSIIDLRIEKLGFVKKS